MIRPAPSAICDHARCDGIGLVSAEEDWRVGNAARMPVVAVHTVNGVGQGCQWVGGVMAVEHHVGPMSCDSMKSWTA